MSEVLSDEQALLEILEIEEYLEVEYSEEDKNNILPAIRAGRMFFNKDAGKIQYELLKPIELKNGEIKSVVFIKSPSYLDLQNINKGCEFKQDIEGNTIMDFSINMARAFKAITKLSDMPLGLVERVSRKDMKAMAGLLNFFE